MPAGGGGSLDPYRAGKNTPERIRITDANLSRNGKALTVYPTWLFTERRGACLASIRTR